MRLVQVLLVIAGCFAVAVKPPNRNHQKLTGCERSCAWYVHNTTLDCTSCHCTQIPDVPENIRTQMTKLILAHNSISEIPRLMYTNLTVLELANNNISRIEFSAFNDMVHLERLLLSYNKLTNITHNSFSGVQKLKYLDLNGNSISRLHSSVFYSSMYRTLRHLDLSENGLEFMNHNAVDDLKALQWLKLSSNRLPSLDPMHFAGLHNLTTLILDMNPLETIKNNTFKALNGLKYLSLTNCDVMTVEPLAFRGMTSLQTLMLTSNQLDNLDVYLSHADLRQLHTLVLDNNPMLVISEGQLPKSLMRLYISGCPNLRSIEKRAFIGLTHLKRLYINNNNQLSYIAPDAIDPNSRLQELDLYSNSLRMLSEHLMDWTSNTTLLLFGNAWRCDCNIMWMKTLLPVKVAERIVCVSPSHLTGLHLLAVPDRELLCHDHVTVHSRLALGLIALATVGLVLTQGFLFYRWRRQLLPCCAAGGVRYVALFNVNDGEDDHVTLCREKEHRTSIVKKSRSMVSLPPPVDV